jgi:hypothetical protein
MNESGIKSEVKPLKEPGTGLFAKGNSGGPGRPPGVKNFTTKVREALEKISEGGKHTYEELFVKAILKKAIADQDATIIKLIWNYLDGMPDQNLHIDKYKEEIDDFYDSLPELQQNTSTIKNGIKRLAEKSSTEQCEVQNDSSGKKVG